ncbi:sulfur carrier protein [Lachnospiraceae bacterium XBB1006]|nr:sulfur carrier protein [Lachnospiraceae bacterium XBB1006]
MVKVNGKELPVEGMLLSEFLQREAYPIDRIVVERNLEIVPKQTYGLVKLEAGDCVEVVSFVGGG